MEDYSTWRQTTDGGIRYRKTKGPTITSEDLEKATASEQYIIRAADMDAFHAESFPTPIAFLNMFRLNDRRRMPGSSVFATRRLSFSPAFMNIADPFGVDSEGTYNLDSDDTSAPGGYMYVDIDYEVSRRSFKAEPTEPETFLERSLQANLAVDSHQATRCDVAPGVSGDTPDASDWVPSGWNFYIQRTHPVVTMRCKWPYVLIPDWESLIGALGKVNSIARPLFLNYEPDTVMFDGLSASQRFLWDSGSTYAQPWQLDMSFSAKRIESGNRIYGWNHIYHPTWQRYMFVRMAHQDGATLLHERTDFYNLFVATTST